MYTYSPLKPATRDDGEFRLLTLFPGQLGSPLVCGLSNESISSPRPYEALSYTWGNPKGIASDVPPVGDPTSLYTISMDGQPKEITYNLHAALQNLRDKLKPRVLWVDALCIDQSNNSEKTEQVQMMTKFYEQALRVLCWLGEHDKYVDLAYDTLDEIFWAVKVLLYRYCSKKLGIDVRNLTHDDLQHLAESERMDEESRWRSPFGTDHLPGTPQMFKVAMFKVATNFVQVDGSFGRTSLVDFAAKTFGKRGSLAESIVSGTGKLSELHDMKARMQAMHQVFSNRSYWVRLWIVQELTLAREAIIICGQRSIDLRMIALVSCIIDATDPLREGSSVLFKNGDDKFLLDLGSAMSHMWLYTQFASFQERFRLSFLIIRHTAKLCSEPRDAIFALHGIAETQYIVPDYSRPIPDIYASAVKAIIKRERNFSILCTDVTEGYPKTHDCPPYIDLPSWVPHFESVLHTGDLHSPVVGCERQYYSAGGEMPQRFVIDSELGNLILRLTGCFCGSICETTSRFNPWADSRPDKALFAVLMELKPSSIPSKSSNDSSSDFDFWRAVVLDEYSNRRIKTDPKSLKAFALDFDRALSGNLPDRLQRQLRSGTQNKAICTTSNGDIALVLGDAMVGDLVFVARGATNPFILRPASPERVLKAVGTASSNLKFYEFVGGSYVHGIMDGEVLSGKTLQEEVIQLI